MRTATFVLTSAVAVQANRLSPYNMTLAICEAKSDKIDNGACYQRVFDALVDAELRAVAAGRAASVEQDAAASAVAGVGNAMAWAYDSIAHAHSKHKKLWESGSTT